MEKKKIKRRVGQLVVSLMMLAMGGCCGVLIVKYLEGMKAPRSSIKDMIFGLIFLLAAMYAAMLLQIIIHEGGHLVFGLLTGYRFSSFRIACFMFIREDGRLRLKRLSIAGTGGQCLMIPPELENGKCPYVLYNLGGPTFNLIAAGLCAGLSVLLDPYVLVSTFFMVMTVVGTAFALMNGIPLHVGGVDNDGYNAVSMGKNREALEAFRRQMCISSLGAEGKRLREMPEEWFVMPSEEKMKNSMIAAMGVFACQRLMDEMKFREADEMMERLLSIDTGIVGLHRNLMRVDRIFCELIDENRPDHLEKMMDRELKKFMKSMKNFPSILRTQYCYSLLAEKDREKAEKYRVQFEKMAQKYPYPIDIQVERELMELGCEAAERKNLEEKA